MARADKRRSGSSDETGSDASSSLEEGGDPSKVAENNRGGKGTESQKQSREKGNGEIQEGKAAKGRKGGMRKEPRGQRPGA